MKKIGDYAFYFWENLRNITFENLLEIRNCICDGCSNLELIIFPNSSMIVNSESISSDDTPKLRMSKGDQTIF